MKEISYELATEIRKSTKHTLRFHGAGYRLEDNKPHSMLFHKILKQVAQVSDPIDRHIETELYKEIAKWKLQNLKN